MPPPSGAPADLPVEPLGGLLDRIWRQTPEHPESVLFNAGGVEAPERFLDLITRSQHG